VREMFTGLGKLEMLDHRVKGHGNVRMSADFHAQRNAVCIHTVEK